MCLLFLAGDAVTLTSKFCLKNSVKKTNSTETIDGMETEKPTRLDSLIG